MTNTRLPSEINELKYWVTILYQILEENKRFVSSAKNDWLIDSESLLQKVSFHSLSVLDLLEGTKPSIPTVKSNINFIDFLSISIIVRSCLEAYLVLHYVYLDSAVGLRVRKLRYKIWHASSLSQRQKQTLITGEMAPLLVNERSQYLKYRRDILSSKTFHSKISLIDKNRLINRKAFDWKPQDGWRGVARKSELSEYYWVDIYNLLSSIAHSNAGISNLFSKNPKEVQEGMALVFVSILNFVIPLFVQGYAKLFPKVKKLITQNDALMFRIKVAEGVVSNYKPTS